MFYPDENVRLLRELPDVSLPVHAEGTVVNFAPASDVQPSSVHARFQTGNGAVDATVPEDALEFVISRVAQDRTAVFWSLESEPEQLIESSLHSIMDCGFTVRAGLNAVRLHYDRDERWWKWGDRLTDVSGARIAATAHTWDGCVVAFSGPERYQLEFRLRGRGEAVVLLHEVESAYAHQVRRSESAMGLARVLASLYSDVAAEFCAFPVADPWLMDEDWRSLLRAPIYPDFFLLPAAKCPTEVPDTFRTARLTHERLMLTDLPVKFNPADPPLQRPDRDLQLDRLRKCRALGEKYYDQLYETRFNPTGLYSSAKDAFLDAISTARDLGLADEARALQERLDGIKAVFRSQFS